MIFRFHFEKAGSSCAARMFVFMFIFRIFVWVYFFSQSFWSFHLFCNCLFRMGKNGMVVTGEFFLMLSYDVEECIWYSSFINVKDFIGCWFDFSQWGICKGCAAIRWNYYSIAVVFCRILVLNPLVLIFGYLRVEDQLLFAIARSTFGYPWSSGG